MPSTIAGKDGRDGEPGRDALQIEILPAMVEGKSYPRGTFVLHKGGMVRANRNGASIEELSCWDVVSDGIADWDVTQSEDLRTFTFRVLRTSGQIKEKSLKSPVVLHRGIWSPANTYERGDCVTYDNSMWICTVESTKGQPGVSPDWKLSVRKGGESKPGKNGLDGKDGKNAPDPGVKR